MDISPDELNQRFERFTRQVIERNASNRSKVTEWFRQAQEAVLAGDDLPEVPDLFGESDGQTDDGEGGGPLPEGGEPRPNGEADGNSGTEGRGEEAGPEQGSGEPVGGP